MRLKTIMTLPGLGVIERYRRLRDWAAIKISSRLPKRIRYWVTILEVGKATIDSPNIPATKVEEFINKLDRPKVVR